MRFSAKVEAHLFSKVEAHQQMTLSRFSSSCLLNPETGISLAYSLCKKIFNLSCPKYDDVAKCGFEKTILGIESVDRIAASSQWTSAGLVVHETSSFMKLALNTITRRNSGFIGQREQGLRNASPVKTITVEDNGPAPANELDLSDLSRRQWRSYGHLALP